MSAYSRCSEDGCEKPRKTKGMCDTHYHRQWQRSRSSRTVLEAQRARRKRGHDRNIDKSGHCWVWLGYIDEHGYGKIGSRGAHRRIYELYVDEIPEGMTLDHICHGPDCPGGPTCPHRRCVNPDHLRPATAVDNRNRSAIKGPQHGTLNTHRAYGCRCSICVEAFRAYHRLAYARKKARRAAA